MKVNLKKVLDDCISESKNKEPGFFTMDDVKEIESMDLNAAKIYLKKKVDAMPNAKPVNIKKALNMISGANNINKLMLSVSNFILAQEDPANKVL